MFSNLASPDCIADEARERMVNELSGDAQCVARIAQGDENALRELVALYGQRLYAYALRLTGDPAMAEDVVQDVLLVVWRSAGRFRGEGRVLAWLLGIVHHTAMKALRRRPAAPSEQLEALPSGDPQPEDHLQANEQADWLHRGLERLPLEQRAVLELVFYQGLSLEETARACGCPLGTVKSRMNHARQRLRGLLRRLEDGGEVHG